MNATMVNSSSASERYESEARFAWGQMLCVACLGSASVAMFDCFKFPHGRSPIRFSCIYAAVFIGLFVLCWRRSFRAGGQTVIVNDQSLIVETRGKRDILPWDELDEVTLVGDMALKLKRRHGPELVWLENQGFTQTQWRAIKMAFRSRGFEFKVGYTL